MITGHNKEGEAQLPAQGQVILQEVHHLGQQLTLHHQHMKEELAVDMAPEVMTAIIADLLHQDLSQIIQCFLIRKRLTKLECQIQ